MNRTDEAQCTHTFIDSFCEAAVFEIFGDMPNMSDAELLQKYNLKDFEKFFHSRQLLAVMAVLISDGLDLSRREVAHVVRNRHPGLPVPEELIKHLCDGYLQGSRKRGTRMFGDVETFEKHIAITKNAERLKKHGIPAHKVYELLSKKFFYTPEAIANIVSKINKGTKKF